MDDDKRYGIVVGALGFLCAIGSFFLGVDVQKHLSRVEAVEKGHGEWVVNKTGQTTFKWKEETK